MKLNEEGCAVSIHSDEFMDENPGSDRVSHIYDYNHPFSQFLRGLKNSLKDKKTYEQYKTQMIDVTIPEYWLLQ